MSENYSPTPSNRDKAEASCSPSFNKTIEASRFVKSFGITALIYSLVSALDPTILLFRGSVGVVVGIFVMRYDEAKYFRILGIVIIVGALIPFLSPGILSGVVLWKGIKALGVLSREGYNDEEWAPSRRRAMIGAVTSFIGLLISTAGAQLIFILIAKLYGWL